MTDGDLAALATRLEAIAADPSQAASFAADFDRWAEFADLLADDRARHGVAGPAERAIVALASIHGATHPAGRDPESLDVLDVLDVLDAMDPYAAALFLRGLVLEPEDLARITDAILTRLGEAGSWICLNDDGAAGSNAADVLMANLLAHPVATTPFVILAAAHPHQLLLAGSDPRLAQDVLLAGTDPRQISATDAGTVVRAVIADVDSWNGSGAHANDAYVDQRAFLGALVAPWLFQFGPRASEWAWTEDEAAEQLAWVVADNAAMGRFVAGQGTLQHQFAATGFFEDGDHLDLRAIHELAALWALVGSTMATEERADDARARAAQDVAFTAIQRAAIAVAGAVGGPTAGGTGAKVLPKARTRAVAWLEEHGVVAPEAERAAADARQRFGDRTSTITIISVVTVVGQLIDAGRLPVDCLDELVLDDDDGVSPDGDPGGCTADHAFDRLQRFAASLPPGEARTTVDDVIHVFLNAPAVALMCE